METLWRIPGAVTSIAFLAWFLFTIFLDGALGSLLPKHIASITSISPFLLWLLAVLYKLQGAGRRWCNRATASLVFAYWLLYLLVLFPAGIDRTGSVAGSETLGGLANFLFAASVVLVFDQLAYALPREEKRVGVKTVGYVITLFQLLFPPVALWVAHNRIAAVAGPRGGSVA